MHLLVSSDLIQTLQQLQVYTDHHRHYPRQRLTHHRGRLIQYDCPVSLNSLPQHRRSWHSRCRPACQGAPVSSDNCIRKSGTKACQWRPSFGSAPLQSTCGCRKGNQTRYRTLVPRLWFRPVETYVYPFAYVWFLLRKGLQQSVN